VRAWRTRATTVPKIVATALAVVFAAFTAASGQAPNSYPTDYAKMVEAASREGRLVVYSTTDRAAAAQVLRDFAELYPRIAVSYVELNSGALYQRFLGEVAAGADTADLLWASSMDGQLKMAADGHAATYASPEIPALPKWAVWRNQVYGTTYEPVAFIYNKSLLPAAGVPQDHAQLLALLAGSLGRFKGKVAAYDPERSGVGYLLANQDIKNFPAAWELFRAFGKNAVELRDSADDIMDGVIDGEQTIGYGVFASYAYARAKRASGLGVIIPRDYTLIVSRVAFIAAKARRPNAARLFLDYLVSRRGQDIIANRAELYAVRTDVSGDATARGVTELIGDRARPIAIDEALLGPLTEERRREFSQKWRAAIEQR
jgi:iron(III) transport system substrate-binding protein